MKERKIKIDAIVATANCPCGQGIVSNYNKIINFKEYSGAIVRCEKCATKYPMVRYNPMTKHMHFINKETDESVYTLVNTVKTTKVSKAFYEDFYTFDLEELDQLEETSKPAFKPVKLEIDFSQSF